MGPQPLSLLVRAVGGGCAAILISLVPKYEGTVLHSYWDPVPIVTACTGHTDPSLRIGQKFTKEECDEMLAADLVTAADGVRGCVSLPLGTNMLASFTSFAFNAGVPAFCGSTMARKLNSGDYAGACAELSKWVMANGKKLAGLVRRREAEREICERDLL